MQDLHEVCKDIGFPRRHTAAEKDACDKAADNYSETPKNWVEYRP